MVLLARAERFVCGAMSRLLGVWLVLLVAMGPGIAAASSLPQFLVVDYHPVSKTLVQPSPGAVPLYDYAYRIDVRNAGQAASEVIGTVRSMQAAVVVTDARATFGNIGAYRSAPSTDTVTLRAGRYFDRRLDSEHRRPETGREKTGLPVGPRPGDVRADGAGHRDRRRRLPDHRCRHRHQQGGLAPDSKSAAAG